MQIDQIAVGISRDNGCRSSTVARGDSGRVSLDQHDFWTSRRFIFFLVKAGGFMTSSIFFIAYSWVSD